MIDQFLDAARPKRRKNRQRWITRSIAETLNRDQFLITTLREILIFAIFLTLVVIASIGRKEKSIFYLTHALKGELALKEFTTATKVRITFKQIRAVTDFWHFTTDVLLNVFYVDFYYDNVKQIKPTIEDDKKILFENKLLGVARMRQVRVRSDSCTIHDIYKTLFKSCYGPYDHDSFDTEPYGPKTGTAWTYHDAEETGGIPYTGRIAYYDGGGYYQDFSLVRNDSEKMLNDLKQDLWITRNTRAIFIDFTVYNANTNLFSVCKLVFEFPPSGGIVSSMSLITLHFLHFLNKWDYFVFSVEVLCYIFGLFYLFEETREIVYFRWKYFLQFWTYIDLVIIASVFYEAVVTFSILLPVDDEIKEIINSPSEYGNLEYYGSVKSTYNIIQAILLFLTITKIFKYINFNSIMGQLNDTLKRCAVDIMVFSMMFFIVFIAFACLGFLLFGSQVSDFRSFGISMFTLLRTILGDFNYTTIEKENKILAPAYFLSYVFFVFFVLLNMFLAIINDTYADVKTEIAIAPDENRISSFVRYKIMHLLHKYGHHLKWATAKTDYNITIEKLKTILKRCGFGALQIEMCFARYEIDPGSKVFKSTKLGEKSDPIDVEKDKHIVQLIDYVIMQEQLVQMEKTMEAMVETIGLLGKKIESIEK